ncbi:MAG: hypothetical protein EGR72_11355 [Clostridiales bacterium]|nr:hypothetical protein [Clostridiales bacterium]
MPEYGFFDGLTRSDLDQPSDFPLPKILEQEAERQKQMQDAQKATIKNRRCRRTASKISRKRS